MSALRMATALAIFTGLLLLIHRYLWARLVRDPGWPPPWGRTLGILVFALAASIPLAFPAMRLLPRALNGPLSWIAYSWMGLMLYLFLLTVVGDAGRGAAALGGMLPRDPERRRVLARAIAVAVGTLSGALGLGGMINVARGFVVRRVRVPMPKLPARASGYRIVQMTDVHVGPTIGRGFVESIVRESNALGPDLVVITGDLVDGSVEALRELVAPLAGLRAKDGVFFVTGNHEYYSGADAWIAHLETMGIRVLRNERVDVRGAFDLAGVDDASAGRMLPHHGQDVGRATAGRDPSRALVLLAHQPKAFKHAVAAGVDLQLSGHVHGGQVVPFNWLVRLDQPFVRGLHRVGASWIYVSQGTGYWGPPMRVGTTAELTEIELYAGDGDGSESG
jgi:predicted MPP superfamily phosphohydrolase